MIYLDNAATSYPKPKSVEREVMRCIRDYCGNPGRGAHPLALAAVEAIYSCRVSLADFFSAEHPENFVFVQNATAAINLAIKSKVKRGYRILISDIEHNAVRRPVHKLSADRICEYSLFNASGDDADVLNSIEEKAARGADMLVCTQVSNVTGRLLPIDKIGNFCVRKGIYFIIDASQSAGHIKIDFSKLNFDVFCAPGHKGLFGIQGSGFAYFRKPEELETLYEGGSGYDSSNLFMPNELPERLEAGTLSTPAIVGLLAGMDFVRECGLDTLCAHERSLFRAARERLESIPALTLYAQEKEGAVLLFNHAEYTPEEIARRLARENICVRAGYHCAPMAHEALGTLARGAVRLGFGAFNTLSDLDALWHALK